MEPLWEASPAIQAHAVAAMFAFGLGAVQLVLPKGGGRHRLLGWIWCVAMAVVAVSSFWIHQIRLWGAWSPIHLLSIWTLISLPLALVAARAGRISAHRQAMLSMFFFALVVAGAFTFAPGRIMHEIAFGG